MRTARARMIMTLAAIAATTPTGGEPLHTPSRVPDPGPFVPLPQSFAVTEHGSMVGGQVAHRKNRAKGRRRQDRRKR